MGAVTTAVNAALTAAEKLALGAVRIEGAVADALLRYSTDFPRESAELCAVDGGGVVTLPTEWVEGWSGVSALGYPVATPGVSDSGTVYVDFSFGDATPKALFTVPAGRMVFSVSIALDVAFDGAGAALSIGDAGDHGRLLASSQVDPYTDATYTTSPDHEYSEDTPVLLYITPGTATQGRGTVKVIYSTV